MQQMFYKFFTSIIRCIKLGHKQCDEYVYVLRLSSLQSLDLSNLGHKQCEDMYYMFSWLYYNIRFVKLGYKQSDEY